MLFLSSVINARAKQHCTATQEPEKYRLDVTKSARLGVPDLFSVSFSRVRTPVMVCSYGVNICYTCITPHTFVVNYIIAVLISGIDTHVILAFTAIATSNF